MRYPRLRRFPDRPVHVRFGPFVFVLQRTYPHWGINLVARQIAKPGLWSVESFKALEGVCKMRYPSTRAAKGAARDHASPEGLVFEAPNFCEFMVSSCYGSEDKPRQSGFLMVWCDQGKWIGEVKDGTAAVKLRCSADTWESLIATIEAVLRAEEVPWEVDPRANGKRKK